MIRAFTISFEFEGKTYLALASIKTANADDTTYSIRIYSNSLHRIFPDGFLRYSDSGVESPVTFTHPLAQPLFHCINESVHEHLKLAQ